MRGRGDREREGGSLGASGKEYPAPREAQYGVKAGGAPAGAAAVGDEGNNDNTNRSGVATTTATTTTTTTTTAGGGSEVKRLSAVANVHAAFGIRAGSDSSEEDDEYVVNASTGVMEKRKRRVPVGGGGSGSTGRARDPGAATDLAEAAKAISNPLFGNSSRAVGRQAGGKVRPPAASSRRNLAVHKSKGSAVNRLSLAGATGRGGNGGGGGGGTRVPPAGDTKGGGDSETAGGKGEGGGGGRGDSGRGGRGDGESGKGTDPSGESYLTVGGYFVVSEKEGDHGEI